MQMTQALVVAAPAITGEELCERYAAEVFRFASIATGGHPDAEDIAQEALLKAVRSLPRFDPLKGSAEAWLWRIVSNSARDAVRARRRRLALFERLGEAHVEPRAGDEEVVARAEIHELLALLARLGSRDRTLVGLRYGVGLGFASIGAATGMKTDAARIATHRALARLRALLEGGDVR